MHIKKERRRTPLFTPPFRRRVWFKNKPKVDFCKSGAALFIGSGYYLFFGRGKAYNSNRPVVSLRMSNSELKMSNCGIPTSVFAKATTDKSPGCLSHFYENFEYITIYGKSR